MGKEQDELVWIPLDDGTCHHRLAAPRWGDDQESLMLVDLGDNVFLKSE